MIGRRALEVGEHGDCRIPQLEQKWAGDEAGGSSTGQMLKEGKTRKKGSGNH